MKMTGKRIKTGDLAPNLKVVNADGETIELSALWADTPVVLAFLRHFG
jgi:peroxiredoxin